MKRPTLAVLATLLVLPALAQEGETNQIVIGPEFGVYGPFAVESESPGYPEAGMAECVKGFVIVQLDVMTDGAIGNVLVRQSEPPGMFESSALGAIAGWSFVPRRVDGVLAPARVQQVFAFQPPPPCPQPEDENVVRLEQCREQTPERYGYVALNLTVGPDGRARDIEVASSTHAFMNADIIASAQAQGYPAEAVGQRLTDQRYEFCLSEDALQEQP